MLIRVGANNTICKAYNFAVLQRQTYACNSNDIKFDVVFELIEWSIITQICSFEFEQFLCLLNLIEVQSDVPQAQWSFPTSHWWYYEHSPRKLLIS